MSGNGRPSASVEGQNIKLHYTILLVVNYNLLEISEIDFVYVKRDYNENEVFLIAVR